MAGKSISPARADDPVRSPFGVRFWFPLTLLQLTASRSDFHHLPVRDRFGSSLRPPSPRQNPFPFFQLPHSSFLEHPTHNRQVEAGVRPPGGLPVKSLPARSGGRSPAVPTIFKFSMSYRWMERPTMNGGESDDLWHSSDRGGLFSEHLDTPYCINV